MEFSNLGRMMLAAAKSEMTAKTKDRKRLFSDIGDDVYVSIKDDDGNTITFDSNGAIDDIDAVCDEDSSDTFLQNLKDEPSKVSVYFSYEFGGGNTVFVRKGDGFEPAPPKKTIKEWQDAFPHRDNEAWEQRVIGKLSKLDPRFPYAWIDYDSDFGYQGIILYISKDPEPCCVEDEEAGSSD